MRCEVVYKMFGNEVKVGHVKVGGKVCELNEDKM
jgi:hypothetical protein